MQSDIVRRTSGCSCTVGLVSDARAVESSGFMELSAILKAGRWLEFSSKDLRREQLMARS